MTPDTSILDLLRQLRDDTATLVREEVRLAKTEMGEKLSRAGRNVAYLVLGALVASSALGMLLMSLGYLLAGVFLKEGHTSAMSAFLGFLVVAIFVAIVAALLIARSLKALANDSLAPTRTVRSLEEDKQWAKEKLS